MLLARRIFLGFDKWILPLCLRTGKRRPRRQWSSFAPGCFVILFMRRLRQSKATRAPPGGHSKTTTTLERGTT
jgi:hypothetical protein